MRPRPYAIGHKVNSLLFEPSLSTYETWLLPHAWTLHILKYKRDDHGGSKDQGQAWKRRRKKKQGRASGKPGTSGLSPELPACPEPPDPGVQTSPEHANSLDSPEPGRNLPGTSGARNFRPRPELPACLCAENGPRAHVSPSHLPLRGLALYILPHLLLVRVSIG